MKTFFAFIALSLICSCTSVDKREPYTSVTIAEMFNDSVSIRAIELIGANTLAFAGSNGVFGSLNTNSGKVMTNTKKYDSIIPEFRAIGHTSNDFFMLSVASPALLYKTGEKGQMQLVYKEEGEQVFYDSMAFFDDQEGIAVGDSFDGCLSIIKTYDGGKTWKKLKCSSLPEAVAGEGAFAASNTNIEIIGNRIWVATTAARIYFSQDRGETWQIQSTPIMGEEDTQGIYSIDFYDSQIGFAIGGDYTDPEVNSKNKALTLDGGATWKLMADATDPGYKSCVQFVPNSDGQELVALGFTGVSYSHDQGQSWKKLSDEAFYTLRFQNDSTAFAAGKNRIAKLVFK